MAEPTARSVVGDARLADVIAAFGHLLHAAGVPVTPERSSRFAEAVLLVRPRSLAELRHVGHTTLLSNRDQIEVFDRVFDQVFRGVVDIADLRRDSEKPAPPSVLPSDERAPSEEEEQDALDAPPRSTSALPDEGSGEGSADEEAEEDVLAAVSLEERLGTQDFAACSDDEIALINALVERLAFVPPPRRGRRLRRHHRGTTLDVRSTLRASHRTHGDPVERVHRKATLRPRRVVLIADVSGSMEPYARVYLHLMRGAVRALRSEAFVFATRLTRLTRQLGMTHPDIAYRKAAEAAPDWSGGTRIGAALQQFVDDYGRRGMARGAVVVVVSDGWEIDDPERVEQAMEQLSRLAFHIIWVNPRKAARDYRPVVGGMAAALPFVDTFVSGHSLRALEEVMRAIHAAAEQGRRRALVRPLGLPETGLEPVPAAPPRTATGGPGL